MLEQFADGDQSFQSDCTLVKKVMKPELSPMIKTKILEKEASEEIIPSVSDVEEEEDEQ